jgi:hypothetical protein
MHLRIIALFLFTSLACSSCSIILKTYGYKNPKQLTPSEIADYATAYKIPAENSFELDTAYYSRFLKKQNQKRYYQQVYNHSQPLQALYFDNTGNLQRFYINCYAGGFPNLDWDHDGNFNSFPPKHQAPADSLVNFQALSPFLKPLPESKLKSEKAADYTVVIIWNRMLGRQSKRLIRYVQQNATMANGRKIEILYVNNDDLMASQ